MRNEADIALQEKINEAKARLVNVERRLTELDLHCQRVKRTHNFISQEILSMERQLTRRAENRQMWKEIAAHARKYQ